MPEPLRKLGHFVAALCFVFGLIAVVDVPDRPRRRRRVAARDRARARGRGDRAGAAARPVPDLLGGYSGIVYAFLFLPILVVVIYAFNAGTNTASFDGFSTRWFGRALDDETITVAIKRSFQIAIASAVIATVFGTAAALALSRVTARARPVRHPRVPHPRRSRSS